MWQPSSTMELHGDLRDGSRPGRPLRRLMIEAFTGGERLRVDYDTPFIRHLPTLFTVQATKGTDLSVAVDRPSYRDPYTAEWLHFFDAITAQAPVATTLEDSGRRPEALRQHHCGLSDRHPAAASEAAFAVGAMHHSISGRKPMNDTNGRGRGKITRRSFLGTTAAAAAAMTLVASGPHLAPKRSKFWDMVWGTGATYTAAAKELVGSYQPAGDNLGVRYQSILGPTGTRPSPPPRPRAPRRPSPPARVPAVLLHGTGRDRAAPTTSCRQWTRPAQTTSCPASSTR